MDNIVYSYGGGEALFKVLTGVRMVFENGLTQDILYLMTFIGLAWAAFQAAQQNSWTPKLSWLTKYTLITSLFITPTATLWVSDSVTGFRHKVDGLPIGLVLPASVFSSIGFGITQLFDQAFDSVGSNISYHKYGQSFGAALISQARNFKIQDSVFRENMESFIDNCMLYDVMVGSKYTASEIKDEEDIWKKVSDNASSIRMMNYRDSNKSLGRRLVTCKEGVGLLNSYWTKDINKLGQRFGSTIFGKFGSKISEATQNDNQELLGKAFTANINVVTKLYGKTREAENTLKQIMMINAISDIPLSYGAVRAKQQQQESWLISGQLAREILPTLHSIFAALIYASFTLIIGMLVLPNGFRTLANYFGLLIWIETWPPLFAVINLLTNFSSKTYGGDFTAITMNNASQIISHNNNISVVASGMMIVLPYLSYNILKGGAGQFVHLASQVMGASQSAAVAASNEVTTGNRSFDNISLSNGQWFNNSGFKTDMNRSYRSGHSEYQLADGTIAKETLSGNTILQSGPGITHSVGAKSMHMSVSNNSQTHESLSREQSELASKQKEYSTMEQNLYRQTADFIERLAQGEARGEHYDFNHTTGTGKVLNDAISEAKELQDNYVYNQNQKVEVGFGGRLGFSGGGQGSGEAVAQTKPKGVFSSLRSMIPASLDISTSRSADESNLQSMAENNSASKREELNKQTEDVIRASKDIQFNETQTEEKAMADSLSGSYEKMQQIRDSINVSEQKVQRYQTSIDNTQSSGFNVSDDMYHKELEFIANQRDNTGFKIGAVKAKNIIDNGDELYEKYHQAFQSKYLPQQRMLTPRFDYEKLKRDHIAQDVDFKKDYNEISKMGRTIMDESKVVIPDVKNMVMENQNSIPNKLLETEQKILQNGENLQESVDHEANDKRSYFSPGRDKKIGEGFKE